MADFRSDTVTRPTEGMRAAMAQADLGDDVFGDDPSVRALQAEAAEMLGFEAALFAPSGTQSNLIGIMSQCGRGDEVIVGQMAHTYRWEGGGMAVLGSIQPQPVENERDGSLSLARVRAAIKPDDPHFARTRMLALENTFNGKVLGSDYLSEAKALARESRLALHLDGARLFNAAVELAARAQNQPGGRGAGVTQQVGIPQQARQDWVQSPSRGDVIRHARDICDGFDSVSICLSKGLGCPVGSLILGSEKTIANGRRIRKMLGGGMRQSGGLAAAGRYALTHHLARLDQDHRLAASLAAGLEQVLASHSSLQGQVSIDPPQTNMVFIEVEATIAAALAEHLMAKGMRFTSSRSATGRIRQRWVTHLDVNGADIDAAIEAWASWRP